MEEKLIDIEDFQLRWMIQATMVVESMLDGTMTDEDIAEYKKRKSEYEQAEMAYTKRFREIAQKMKERGLGE